MTPNQTTQVYFNDRTKRVVRFGQLEISGCFALDRVFIGLRGSFGPKPPRAIKT
jgi:hypothetical protein